MAASGRTVAHSMGGHLRMTKRGLLRVVERRQADEKIIAWADGVDAPWLAGDLTWVSAAVNREFTRPRGYGGATGGAKRTARPRVR